uniref:Putative nuclear speckle splicing regulatory protein 1 n=1 Tax=Davidia involucrata TaxID=16924 RepID=A0A5B7BAA6_DAVIN
MKKYGLQLRVQPSQQKKQPTRPPLPTPLGFHDEDEDDVEREISRQASKNKALKDIEEQHKKALEEDPSVFDYDGVYDEMKQKAVRPLAHDRHERKPKYIQTLIEKAKQREREHEIIYERKIAVERSKDDHLYADKDKFVTSAYKKKLAEQAKWLEEERLRQLREERDDVTKKKDITDFYFSLSKNVAFGAKEAESRKPEKRREEVTVDTSEKAPPSTNMHMESSKVRDGHHGEASTLPEERSESIDAKPNSNASSQEKAVAEPVADEPKSDDHHKRSQDAVSAAKERFLARKRAKE